MLCVHVLLSLSVVVSCVLLLLRCVCGLFGVMLLCARVVVMFCLFKWLFLCCLWRCYGWFVFCLDTCLCGVCPFVVVNCCFCLCCYCSIGVVVCVLYVVLCVFGMPCLIVDVVVMCVFACCVNMCLCIVCVHGCC